MIEKPHALLTNALDQAVKWEYISSNPAERATHPQYRSAERDVWSVNEALYAWNWYHIYAALNIATATTYKRQLTKYIIPAFDGLCVEDITVDVVQQLFNSMAGANATKETEPYTVEQMRYLIQHIGDIKRPDDRAYLAIHALHPLRP